MHLYQPAQNIVEKHKEVFQIEMLIAEWMSEWGGYIGHDVGMRAHILVGVDKWWWMVSLIYSDAHTPVLILIVVTRVHCNICGGHASIFLIHILPTQKYIAYGASHQLEIAVQILGGWTPLPPFPNFCKAKNWRRKSCSTKLRICCRPPKCKICFSSSDLKSVHLFFRKPFTCVKFCHETFY